MIQSLPGYNLYPSSKINLLGSYLNSRWDDACQINDSSNNIFGAERNRKFVNIQTVGLREGGLPSLIVGVGPTHRN